MKGNKGKKKKEPDGAGGNVEALREFLRRAVSYGRGRLESVEEEGENLLKTLIQRGQLTEEEGRKVLKDFAARVGASRRELQQMIDERLQKGLKAARLTTRHQASELEKRIDSLSKRVDKLIVRLERKVESDGGPSGPAAAAGTAARKAPARKPRAASTSAASKPKAAAARKPRAPSARKGTPPDSEEKS